jgi:hypothetical protein
VDVPGIDPASSVSQPFFVDPSIGNRQRGAGGARKKGAGPGETLNSFGR